MWLRRLAILGCLPFNAVYQMTKLVTFDQLILPYLIILLYGSALWKMLYKKVISTLRWQRFWLYFSIFFIHVHVCVWGSRIEKERWGNNSFKSMKFNNKDLSLLTEACGGLLYEWDLRCTLIDLQNHYIGQITGLNRIQYTGMNIETLWFIHWPHLMQLQAPGFPKWSVITRACIQCMKKQK